MNEGLRQHYLEALGVTQYVPRFVLPNALSSRLCELPLAREDDEPAAGEDTVPGAISAPAMVRARFSLDAFEPEDTAAAPAPAPQAARSVTDTNKTAVAETSSERVSLNLALWRAPRGIHILDSREPDDALPTPALVQQIVARHFHGDHVLGSAEVIRWPFPGQQDSSWQAAHAMLQGFVESRVEAGSVTALVLCGEMATRALLGESPSSFADRCFQSARESVLDLEVLVLPSLRDILAQPKLKSALWRSLRRFLKARAFN